MTSVDRPRVSFKGKFFVDLGVKRALCRGRPPVRLHGNAAFLGTAAPCLLRVVAVGTAKYRARAVEVGVK
jgi:hypothetical protein